jgi:hypothetical protein
MRECASALKSEFASGLFKIGAIRRFVGDGAGIVLSYDQKYGSMAGLLKTLAPLRAT